MSGNDDSVEQILSLLVGFTLLALLIVAIMVLPVLALASVPLVALGVWFIKFKNNPTRKEAELRAHLVAMYERTKAGTLAGYTSEDIKRRLSNHIAGYVLGTDAEGELVAIGKRVIDRLDIATTVPKPPSVATGIESGRYLDRLAKISTLSPETVQEVIDTVAEVLGYVSRQIPRTEGTALVPLSHFIKDKGEMVEAICGHFADKPEFAPIMDILEENLAEQKGVMPRSYKGDDVVEVYLKGTPLEYLFDIDVPFGLPFETRFSHMHIIGMTGSGKTTLIESFIAEDIKAGHNVILVDGQGDLIKRLLPVCPTDRLIHIDPTDVEYPLALNLFDVGQARFATYSPLAKEKAINGVVELFNFVFNAFLADLTAKQDTLFSFITLLLLEIPNANIMTMMDILDVNGIEPYRAYTKKLSPVGQRFFDTDFNGPEFTTTKREIRRRLVGLMKTPTFMRMFSHVKSKFSMYEAMDGEGTIILINTAKSLLKQDAHRLFGRLFIAMILQATQERADTRKRQPTFLYIDECYEYLDENVETLLETARKYRVGCVLAHGYLDQLSQRFRADIHGSTAIKLAGGLSAGDTAIMAKNLRTSVEAMTALPQYSFMAYIRGVGTLPWRAPADPFAGLERNSDYELELHREEMRERYCEPVAPSTEEPPPAPDDEQPDQGDKW